MAKLAGASELKKELLKRYKLTKEKLEQICSGEDMTNIQQFISWKSVGDFLVKRNVLTDIDKNGHDEEDKRRLLMNELEQMGSRFTYDVIIVAMLKANKIKEAERVCEMLNPIKGKAIK